MKFCNLRGGWWFGGVVGFGLIWVVNVGVRDLFLFVFIVYFRCWVIVKGF